MRKVIEYTLASHDGVCSGPELMRCPHLWPRFARADTAGVTAPGRAFSRIVKLTYEPRYRSA